VDAHTFTKQAENKRCLPARKLMITVFWDRKGVLMAESMQQGIQ
jgi:acyl-CoA thioesterase